MLTVSELDKAIASLVDPFGEKLVPSVVAPVPDGLDGKVLGLLDNTKWNADLLLRTLGEELKNRTGIGEIRFYRKDTWGRPAPAELCDRIVAECDLVVTASGD